MPRFNILLQRFPAPKGVELPNSRIFLQNIKDLVELPEREKIRRTYVSKIGPRRLKILKLKKRVGK